MKEDKEYVVTFPVSQQITEDRWTVLNPSLKVTSATTVGEIEAFYRKYHPNCDGLPTCDITLIELQKSSL